MHRVQFSHHTQDTKLGRDRVIFADICVNFLVK